MSQTGQHGNLLLMTRVSVYPLHETVHSQDLIISDEARRMLEIIFYSTLGGLIGVVGSVANVINIIVFVKQGFNDSASISLGFHAVSDLGFLLIKIWMSACFSLYLYTEIGFDFAQINNITTVIESCFVRTAGMITAFIAFERCVCIAMPFRVKNLITTKRTLIAVLVFHLIVYAANLPIFSYVYLAPSFNAKRNETILDLKFKSTFQTAAQSFTVSVQISCFIIVIVCTVILVLKLLSKSEFRHKTIYVHDVSDSLTTRDKRVMKMVTYISIIFIACYVPNAINLIITACFSVEYSPNGSYENLYFVSWAIIDFTHGLNSTGTILIYYNMSSKFRGIFKYLSFISKISHIYIYNQSKKPTAQLQQ